MHVLSALDLLRLMLDLVLLPIRLLLALTGGVAVLFGGVGAIAWMIQLLLGGRGSGPLAPALMWLLSIAAIPAGLLMLTVAYTGVENQPPTDEPSIALSDPDMGEQDTLRLAGAERTTTVVPELRTTVRILTAPHEQIPRRRRANASVLRRTPRRRPL